MSVFPPEAIQGIVSEISALLKEKRETVAVAETVRLRPSPDPARTKSDKVTKRLLAASYPPRSSPHQALHNSTGAG